MPGNKHIIFTVTNDLNYDQRMIRICTSLAQAGYTVTLVGFRRKKSKPLQERPYRQVRIPILAEQGKLLYAGYWIMLLFYLLFKRFDAICAIDLDTILPVYFVSLIRNKRRVYDAHELFTELKELVNKPAERKIWSRIEAYALPRFEVRYTVGDFCAIYFERKYGKHFDVVRNATILQPYTIPQKKERYILYQGWVNEGRCFEEMIPAMQYVDIPMIVCGEGNFYRQAQELAKQYHVQDKVIFKGFLPPEQLRYYTEHATIGISIFNSESLNNQYSLANRFFDFMHHGIPQLCTRFPEYEKINSEFEIAKLIEEHAGPEAIAAALNEMLNNTALLNKLQQNAMLAREKYCWQHEEQTLLGIYSNLFRTRP